MKLYIGNKNYSSWSLRPWVLMTETGIAFDEVRVRFDSFDEGSHFKTELAKQAPPAKVPVLVDDGFAVWDTLAIAEYLAERFPEKNLWPADRLRRARARSLCAEMHSGFGAVRSNFGMNIEASLPEVGRRVLADNANVRADVARLVSMWTELLAESGGPMLFGDFTIVDAYFAPVVSRFTTYGVPVPPVIQGYMDRVQALQSMAAWRRDALAEQDFLPFEEPYRTSR